MTPDISTNETTNAVLRESIQGLSKLTDERFNNIQQTLLRIENSTHLFATKIELEEVKKEFFKDIKAIKEEFIQHNIDDKNNFGGIVKQNEGLDNKFNSLKTRMAYGMGGLAVITFVAPYVIKYIFKI